MSAIGVAASRADEYARLLKNAGESVTEGVAEVVLADPDRIASLDLGPVRWVQSTWAGVDAVDWGSVPGHVVVTTLPGVFGPQMAEFVFGHLLARTQRIPQRYATRHWDETVPDVLGGTTIGILGAGSIGNSIAEVATSMGMFVHGCRRSDTPNHRYDSMYEMGDLAGFATGLDHLVAVLPGTDETRGLIDAELLRRLAPGASFINVGRGSTAVTDDVVACVRDGSLGLAVLDVTDPEPLPPTHPAWETPGIVITGHTAAHSRPLDIVEFFLANLARFRGGQRLRGVVDRERGY